jgi:hypothetical protein
MTESPYAPGDETGEETEPEPFVEPAGDEEEVAGIPGQIEYPDRDVDAERAGEYAAGKVDTLEDPDAEEDDEAAEQRRATQTPQENRMEDQHRAEATQRRADQEGTDV